MNLIIAVLLWAYLGYMLLREKYRDIQYEIGFNKYRSVWKVAGEDTCNSAEVQRKLENPETRKQCFDEINDDMTFILGSDWRDRFDSFESDWRFKNLPKILSSYGSQFFYLEKIVFYVILAKEYGRSVDTFDLHDMRGFSHEEAREIIKRTCLVIEQHLKEKHQELDHELDMLIYHEKDMDKIVTRYKADSSRDINTEERLELGVTI